MTASNEAWISDSLARLEQLEAQREQLAAAGRTEALAELEEEIKSLYEVLESAADDGSAANNSPTPQSFIAAAPVHAVPSAPHFAEPMQSAPQFSAPMQSAPQFSAPMQSAPQFSAPIQAPFTPQAAVAMDSPFSAPPMAPPVSMAPSFESTTSASYDDDVSTGGGKGLVIGILAIVLIGGGVGGWWFFGRAQPEPVAPGPTGPATVIQAGAIPDDTQNPNVAKGGDASRTPEVVIKEPAARPEERRPTSSSSRPNTPSSKPARDDKPSGRSDAIDVDKSNDPLAGVR